MNYVLVLLIVLFAALQYDLWVGKGSIVEVKELEAAVALQTKENQNIRERNDALQAEVLDLKNALNAIEERARTELGMIKSNETFFHVIEKKRFEK